MTTHSPSKATRRAGPGSWLALASLCLALTSLALNGWFAPGPKTVPAEDPLGGGTPASGPSKEETTALLESLGPQVFLARQPLLFGTAWRRWMAAGAGPEGGVASGPQEIPGRLHAPQGFQARIQEGGIRLQWLPHPDNPVEGRQYQLSRWTGTGSAELLAEISGLEYLDRVECEGLTYHYRLRASYPPRMVGGVAVLRESPWSAAQVVMPRRAQWQATGLQDVDQVLLSLSRPGRPTLGPFAVRPGQSLGETGWFLEALSIRDTRVKTETRIPRFDALGRRVIIDGRPADRVREVTADRLQANVRLTDPCGTSWSLELLLPEGTAKPESEP
ncbi:MAG: hypothetical protein DWQ01_13850 [Planctomycetota bacterium]|nr:MAG: hypothetical protein DWQ01_13850 [Planctomycetota bacterium]